MDPLYEVMGEIVSELPHASEALTAHLETRARAAMTEESLAAANTRARRSRLVRMAGYAMRKGDE